MSQARPGSQNSRYSRRYARISRLAGQSFGAFLTAGITCALSGEANDYVGKGLSGGTIVDSRASRNASKRGDVLAGNTVLYGATSGQLYRCRAGGRTFCRSQ